MSEEVLSKSSRVRNYAFHDIAACNMCGMDAAKAKILGLRLDQTQGRRPGRQRGIAVSICRCGDCGLIFSNPQPVPNSISDHYDVPPEAYWKDVRYDVPQGYFRSQADTAVRLVGDPRGVKAIDVGLGLGRTARVLRDRGFDVYGLEPSAPFFRKAVEILGEDEERYQLGSIEDADFPAGEYGFVTFGAVLEHLYDPSAALQKAVRWLKLGGIIHAEIPNADHLVARLVNFYYRLRGTTLVTHTSPMHMPYHLYEFTKDSFETNGKRNGFEVAEHSIEVGTIYNLPRIVHPILDAVMKRRQTGMQLTVWLRKTA